VFEVYPSPWADRPGPGSRASSGLVCCARWRWRRYIR
jgi:hypothetical protein